MNNPTHNAIVSFIWGIVDDVLRDVYVCGKYRDVVLPMTVICRIDCLLEPTKDKVYRKFVDDPEFREWILDVLFKQDYDKGMAAAGV